MKYTFAFSVLTVGDARDLIAASTTGDMLTFLRIVEKCSPGIYDLPMTELSSLCKQFVDALNIFLQDAAAPDALRILRQALEGRKDDL